MRQYLSPRSQCARDVKGSTVLVELVHLVRYRERSFCWLRVALASVEFSCGKNCLVFSSVSAEIFLSRMPLTL